MGRTAHLCNGQGSSSTDGKHGLGPIALPIIRRPSMTPTESFPLGLNGLQLAWESVGVVLGALALGLLVGFIVRARSSRADPSAGPRARLQERELASLRRIASDLARAGDVEAVVRTLLDEIAALFEVGFVALTFVSDDGREASGFLARSHGDDIGWGGGMRGGLPPEATGIANPG